MLGVGVVIVLGCAWWVTNSKVFDLRSVRVSGNVHLTADRIEQLAGVGSQTNVFWMSTGSLEELVERNPWVADARVTRTLPSTITITVVERIPVAVGEGARLLLVAGDGTILGRATDRTRLPHVALPPGPQLVPGDRVASQLPQLSVAAALPEELRASVVRIDRDADASIVLDLRSGVKVYFGDSGRAGAKATALQALLAWAARNGVEPDYLDVRSPSAPALMPVGGRPSHVATG